MKTERLIYYRRLAHAGNKNAQRVVDAFDPDQPRDADGKWGSGGGGPISSAKSWPVWSAASAAKAAEHRAEAAKARASGEKGFAAAHENAAKELEEHSKTGWRATEAKIASKLATERPVEPVESFVAPGRGNSESHHEAAALTHLESATLAMQRGEIGKAVLHQEAASAHTMAQVYRKQVGEGRRTEAEAQRASQNAHLASVVAHGGWK